MSLVNKLLTCFHKSETYQRVCLERCHSLFHPFSLPLSLPLHLISNQICYFWLHLSCFFLWIPNTLSYFFFFLTQNMLFCSLGSFFLNGRGKKERMRYHYSLFSEFFLSLPLCLSQHILRVRAHHLSWLWIISCVWITWGLIERPV